MVLDLFGSKYPKNRKIKAQHLRYFLKILRHISVFYYNNTYFQDIISKYSKRKSQTQIHHS